MIERILVWAATVVIGAAAFIGLLVIFASWIQTWDDSRGDQP